MRYVELGKLRKTRHGDASRIPRPEIGEKCELAWKFQPKNACKWRLVSLIIVHLLMLIHIVHWQNADRTIAGLEPSEAMEFSKYGIINLGFVLLIGVALVTAVFGRFFCGWGCHIIAMQDLSRWLLLKAGITPKPLRSRVLRWVPIMAFVYMFVWPIVYQLVAGHHFPSITTQLTTSNLWAAMPGWVIGSLTIVICGFAIVYVVGAKGFCTYACPYGALFGVADRLAPLRIRVTDACRHCARCTAACTSNVRVHEQVREFAMVRGPGCMKCLDCVSVCPNDALYVGLGQPALGAKARGGQPPAGRPWNVDWPGEVILAITFALGFATFRGLYNWVPFLLALGLGVILAFLSLTAFRLRVKPDLRWVGVRLKRDGRITSAGRRFILVLILVSGFWAHGAAIRYHELQSQSGFAATTGLRASALSLDFAGISRISDRELQESVQRAYEHITFGQKWGLIDNPSSFFKAAWFEFLMERPDTALISVEKALEYQPGAAEVHRLHGRVLVAAGRPQDAVLAFARSIELEPSASAGFISLGSLLGALGDVPRAHEVFRRGLLRHPDNADLLYNFGVACALQGHENEAAAAFERTLEINAGHEKAKENLAHISQQ